MIALHQMRWPDEVRPPGAVPAPAAVDVTDTEIQAAVDLAAALATGGFELSEQRDAYRAAVEEVIASKESGRPVAAAGEPALSGEVVDLMAALQKSVEDARAARQESRRLRPRPPHGQEGRDEGCEACGWLREEDGCAAEAAAQRVIGDSVSRRT
ncbi:hypothetical protein AB0D46_15660 [Streptomyces sp. NPDC048383]|uniref:hypothetical protein n=1 Tax=Streptomyces sp. NPDC048383 TaxID=3155386 RepID=UPI003443B185